MSKTVIRIGHPAYNGTNSMHLCFSKAKAVRVLQGRGIKRDAARAAVALAVKETGSSVSESRWSESIEIVCLDRAIQLGYYGPYEAKTIAYWNAKPEVL